MIDYSSLLFASINSNMYIGIGKDMVNNRKLAYSNIVLATQ